VERFHAAAKAANVLHGQLCHLLVQQFPQQRNLGAQNCVAQGAELRDGASDFCFGLFFYASTANSPVPQPLIPMRKKTLNN